MKVENQPFLDKNIHTGVINNRDVVGLNKFKKLRNLKMNQIQKMENLEEKVKTLEEKLDLILEALKK